VTPNGRTAYVSIRNDNAVKGYDVSGETPVPDQRGTFIGVQPDTLRMTNDGKTLVVGLRSIPQMALMDTETLSVRSVHVSGLMASAATNGSRQTASYTFVALESTMRLANPGR
jgi:hypothetical protein